MQSFSGYTHRRKNRRVRLALTERPRRRKIIKGKDHYLLELIVAESTDGTFASARKNYTKTKRYMSVSSMQVIVEMFFELTYGFKIEGMAHGRLGDDDTMLLRGTKRKGS